MSDCQHEWKFQQDYSKAGSIRRFTCVRCGVWGWNVPPNKWEGFKEKPIRAYKGNRMEPDSTWKQNQRRFLPTADAPFRDRAYAEDVYPTRMEQAVCSVGRFRDPGEL